MEKIARAGHDGGGIRKSHKHIFDDHLIYNPA